MEAGQKEARAHLGKELDQMAEMISGARAHLMLPNEDPKPDVPHDTTLTGVLDGQISRVRRLRANLRPVVNALSALHDALA